MRLRSAPDCSPPRPAAAGAGPDIPSGRSRTRPSRLRARRFHQRTVSIPQQKQIRAGSRIALAPSRMRIQEQWRRSRKSPAPHQKAHRRSSHFRKKFFSGKNPRASPQRNPQRRKRLQIQGCANLAATTPRMRAACVCELSRIHPVSTASMTLACHVRAQLVSNASDLQGVARHGSAPSLRSACDARGPAWCCRVIGDVLHGLAVFSLLSRQQTGNRRSLAALTHALIEHFHAARPRAARRAWMRTSARPTYRNAPALRRARRIKQVPLRRPARRLGGPRPDARQGMRRGSCATKDQGSLS